MLFGASLHTMTGLQRALRGKADFERKIVELRMCRIDLSEKVIRKEAQKEVYESFVTPSDVITGYLHLAAEGKLMPWEVKNERD